MPYIVLEALAAGMPMIATRGRRHPGDFREFAGAGRPDAGELARRWPGRRRSARYRTLMPGRADLKARFSAAVMARHIELAYFGALDNVRSQLLAAMRSDRAPLSALWQLAESVCRTRPTGA